MKSYTLTSQINMMFMSSLVLFFVLSTIDAQHGCSETSANCINIHNCSEIITILRNARPLSPQVLETLRELHCGFEGNVPKVCCGQQQTTNMMTTPTPPTTTTTTKTTTTTMTTTTMMMTTTTMTTTAAPNSEDIADPPDVTNHPNLQLLDHKKCGPAAEPRVLLGNKTEIFQYPWMALIAYESNETLNPQFLCSGTIISSRYILTAAHCVTSLPGTLRLKGVRVGDHDISKERDCEYFNGDIEIICAEKYQDFDVNNFYFHPEYTTTELQNDIGLIRLNDSIDFAPQTVRPICLPLGTAAKVNLSRAKVTGWNLAEFDRRNTYLLQERQLVVSNEQCKEKYNQSKYQIWYKQLCAGGGINVIGGPNTCLGDGGSPLQTHSVYGTSVRVVQYGILSYGATSCGIVGIPDVYTRVAYYMDWILNTMTD